MNSLFLSLATTGKYQDIQEVDIIVMNKDNKIRLKNILRKCKSNVKSFFGKNVKPNRHLCTMSIACVLADD